jgi:hypothetical protein
MCRTRVNALTAPHRARNKQSISTGFPANSHAMCEISSAMPPTPRIMAVML